MSRKIKHLSSSDDIGYHLDNDQNYHFNIGQDCHLNEIQIPKESCNDFVSIQEVRKCR